MATGVFDDADKINKKGWNNNDVWGSSKNTILDVEYVYLENLKY